MLNFTITLRSSEIEKYNFIFRKPKTWCDHLFALIAAEKYQTQIIIYQPKSARQTYNPHSEQKIHILLFEEHFMLLSVEK